MKLTPLAIRKHEFARSFRGYDAEDVDAFLNMVSQHWHTMSEDQRRMEERLEEQTQRVNHYLKVEEALEHALDNARTLSKEKLESAEREAGERLRDAEERVSRTLEESQRTAESTLREAERKSSALGEKSERRLEKVTRQAADAEARAVKDLAAMDDDRRQILERFRQFLHSELDALRRYDLSEPGPATTAFAQAMETGVPDSPSVTEESSSPADSAGAVAEVPEEAKAAPLPEIETAEAPPHVVVEPEAEPPEANPKPAAEPAAEVEPRVEVEAVVETEAEAEMDSDSFLENLPSAEDGFEDPRLSVSGQQPLILPDVKAKPREFGADDEIRKIRRILEDLDS